MSMVCLRASLLLSGNCLDFQNTAGTEDRGATRGRGGREVCGFTVYAPDKSSTYHVISAPPNKVFNK